MYAIRWHLKEIERFVGEDSVRGFTTKRAGFRIILPAPIETPTIQHSSHRTELSQQRYIEPNLRNGGSILD